MYYLEQNLIPIMRSKVLLNFHPLLNKIRILALYLFSFPDALPSHKRTSARRSGDLPGNLQSRKLFLSQSP
jgi:hypothetical protein